MPDPYERHSRNSWEWGPAPPRGQSRAAAADQGLAPAKRPPGKKDPDLCKSAHWKGPHTPEFRLRSPGPQRRKCTWQVDWTGKVGWSCWHEQACAGCGKILLASMRGRQCPDYREITAEETAVLEGEVQARLGRLARWAARRKRPVIDGPQGYRKPKGNA